MNYILAEKKIKDVINSRCDHSKILAEVVDFLYKNFGHYSWVGIYLVEDDYLVLGPWKGLHATEHTRIPIGKGICGSAAASGKTEVIPDVNADSRYLSCFVTTKSEIAVPIKKNKKIIGEIDIDSDIKDAFTRKDVVFLKKVADMLGKHI